MSVLRNSFLLIIILTGISCKNNSRQQNENQSSNQAIKGELIIFHAGSLAVPFREITHEFNKEYPYVKVILEASGSRKCARKIIDLNRTCDIMASADYQVIDNLLIPKYAEWNIKFASNEMAIAFHEKSMYSNEIDETNWFEILLREDVGFGRSDPNSDPCGYRSVLVCKLAEKYYEKHGLSNKILSKDQNYIRPKETDLLALIETNTVDYIFIYRSVANQHNLKYLILPDEINLKSNDKSEFYSSVQTEISGKKPKEKITKTGGPMIYGVTILKEAPNFQAAEAFIQFLLNKEKGMAIMGANGQPSVIPSFANNYKTIPESLKIFAKEDK